jgi:hypothetical protein
VCFKKMILLGFLFFLICTLMCEAAARHLPKFLGVPFSAVLESLDKDRKRRMDWRRESIAKLARAEVGAVCATHVCVPHVGSPALSWCPFSFVQDPCVPVEEFAARYGVSVPCVLRLIRERAVDANLGATEGPRVRVVEPILCQAVVAPCAIVPAGTLRHAAATRPDFFTFRFRAVDVRVNTYTHASHCTGGTCRVAVRCVGCSTLCGSGAARRRTASRTRLGWRTRQN